MCLREHFRRETMRQMKLTNDDLDIDAEIVFVAQDLDYSPSWILSGRRPVGDFYIDDYTFEITSLPEYLATVPTEGLEHWKGELRSGARANVLMGVTSNRVDVKHAAARSCHPSADDLY